MLIIGYSPSYSLNIYLKHDLLCVFNTLYNWYFSGGTGQIQFWVIKIDK